MSLYRFYVPAIAPGRIPLPDDQTHHALHVLRIDPSTPIEVFDGKGASARGVFHPQKREAFVQVDGPVHHEPPPALKLTLAVAVPKADRAEWLVEQASQLGVAAVQWLDTERGVVKPKESGGKLEKHRRLAIESAKQCGRNHLLAIEPMRKLPGVLRGPAELRLWLDPRAKRGLHQLQLPAAGHVVARIGPEGGWSAREEELLAGDPNVTPIRLTPTVLRIETAAAAVAAILLAR